MTPLRVEPEDGGCRAARTLFGFPVGAGGRIRAGRWLMPPSTPPGRWALCTTPHQLELLTELRRTVRSPGRIALLAFVARQSVSDEQPEGNHFSQSTDLPSWSTMPVSGSTHGKAQPTCRPFRRTGLAASTRSPTPWPSGTARRRRGSWPNAKARRSLTSCVWRRRRGAEVFGPDRPRRRVVSLGDATARYVLVLLLSAFQSQDVGYRGAMVKEKPSVLPGLLFGLGFGGFVDGIVLHEILQWHHMISGAQSSETLAGLELNVVADGFFHVVTWLLVMAGSIMTLVSWRQGRLAPTWSFHFGLLVAGWGFFNVVEGLIDHQLLGVHHVRDDLGAPLSWDIGFLVFGVILIGAGWVLYRRGSRKLAASAR